MTEPLGAATIETFVALLVALLVASVTVAMVTKRLRVPYTVALVLVGLLLGLLRFVNPVVLSREVILLIFLPPLLFEGTLTMSLALLRESWREVTLLALPVTCLCAALLATVIHWGLGYAWPAAFLVGVILSPTDPVAVLATLREFGVSRRLALVIEAESCFNDGIGVVLFLIAATVISGHAMSPSQGVLLFAQQALGGVVVGVALGYAAYRVLKRVEDPSVEVALTVAVAYACYMVGERFHASGVIAVVAGGLVVGNYGRALAMSPRTRMVLSSFWGVMSYLANSTLFLLMGITVEGARLEAYAGAILAVFVALTAIRMVLVYGTGLLLRVTGGGLPLAWLHVVGWAGLRGSIPVALALGLPSFAPGPGIPPAAQVSTLVFGVVLASLVIQGLTIKPLLHRLGLVRQDERQQEMQRWIGRRIALVAADRDLQEMNRLGQIPTIVLEGLLADLATLREEATRGANDFLRRYPDLEQVRRATIRRSLALSSRAALEDATVHGLIADEVAEEVRSEIEERLQRLPAEAPESPEQAKSSGPFPDGEASHAKEESECKTPRPPHPSDS